MVFARVMMVALCLLLSPIGVAEDDFDRLLQSHQKMILLLERADNLDPLNKYIHSARNFYVQKHRHFGAIIVQAESESAVLPNNRLLPTTQRLIERYGAPDTWLDGDKLAFADAVEELLLLEQERGLPTQGLIPLKQINADINRLLLLYREEYRRVMQKLGKQRGAKEQWQAYIDHLAERYKTEDILREGLDSHELHREKQRGSGLAGDKKDRTSSKLAPIIWGNGFELPPLLWTPHS